MRLLFPALAAALAVLPMAAAHAQSGVDHTKAHQPAATDSTTYKATGVVKNVDRSKRVVTVAHGPVPALKWPAMTMPFAVKDPALFGKLPAGAKVEFEFAQQGKDYVITGVK